MSPQASISLSYAFMKKTKAFAYSHGLTDEDMRVIAQKYRKMEEALKVIADEKGDAGRFYQELANESLSVGPRLAPLTRLLGAVPDLLQCTKYLLLVCEDRLSILEEKGEPDEDVVKHFTLLKQDAEQALAKAQGC